MEKAASLLVLPWSSQRRRLETVFVGSVRARFIVADTVGGVCNGIEAGRGRLWKARGCRRGTWRRTKKSPATMAGLRTGKRGAGGLGTSRLGVGTRNQAVGSRATVLLHEKARDDARPFAPHVHDPVKNGMLQARVSSRPTRHENTGG